MTKDKIQKPPSDNYDFSMGPKDAPEGQAYFKDEARKAFEDWLVSLGAAGIVKAKMEDHFKAGRESRQPEVEDLRSSLDDQLLHAKHLQQEIDRLSSELAELTKKNNSISERNDCMREVLADVDQLLYEAIVLSSAEQAHDSITDRLKKVKQALNQGENR
jgi:small-conductance mechanosensitive channel